MHRRGRRRLTGLVRDLPIADQGSRIGSESSFLVCPHPVRAKREMISFRENLRERERREARGELASYRR